MKLIDVRNAAEFETAHIPGSYHIPLDAVSAHSDAIGQVKGDIVLVCQSGGRARQAAEKLAGAGVSSITVLEGGIGAWLASGGQANKGKEKWALERQVRLVAGSIVLTSILASAFRPKARLVAGGVGAGLTFAAVSNTCMMGNLLSKLPYNKSAGDGRPTHQVVAALLEEHRAP